MTESDIQRGLFRYFRKSAKIMCDNIYLFGSPPWESDFIILNRQLKYIEVEIKLNKYDYKADYLKVDRHKCLSGEVSCVRPSRFYYCSPPNVILKDEVPSYAGLMYYHGGKTFEIIKKAPVLEKHIMNLFEQLAVKLYYKYIGCRK